MGCVVNGPGEAKEADIGIAGGIGEGLLIKNGEVCKEGAGGRTSVRHCAMSCCTGMSSRSRTTEEEVRKGHGKTVF